MQTYQAASGATPAIRLARWNEQLSVLFSNLTADPVDPAGFDGRLAWGAAGPVTCATAWATRCRMHHGADTGVADAASILLKIQMRGRSHATHLGHAAALQPGDMILFDTEKAHRLTLIEDSSMLAIRLPKSVLGQHVAELERLTGQRLPANNPSVRLCAAYADSLWQLTRAGATHAQNPAGTLAKLLARCAPAPTKTPRGRHSDWKTIELYLQAHAFELDLSIASISADLGITPRWLQRIFAAKGTTPGRYILDMRLEEARRRLADSHFVDTSITDIAFGLGFGDLTYFGRSFRKRYGVPPKGFRKSAAAYPPAYPPPTLCASI